MSDQTGSGSLTALPVIECGRTGPLRINQSRGEIDGSISIQTTMRSNPKTIFASRLVKKKDTFGVQEGDAPLRWAVPKFNRGTPGWRSHTDSRMQVNHRFHRHTTAANFSTKMFTDLNMGIVLRVRVGYLLQSAHMLCGKRIYCSNSQMSSIEGNSGAGTNKMIEHIMLNRDAKGKYSNLIPLISDEYNLFEAWVKIKGASRRGFATPSGFDAPYGPRLPGEPAAQPGAAHCCSRPRPPASCSAEYAAHPGNLTQGGTSDTLHGLSWLRLTSDQLIKGSYIYSPARRVNLPKGQEGKKGTRPLTVANPRDQIVQQAFFQILQPLWEGVSVWQETRTRPAKYWVRKWLIHPIFLNTNHGFRPNRSVHSALKEVKTYWKDVNWFIKFDIKKAFDKVNQHILINEIENVVEDRRVTDELFKMLNVKIINIKVGEPGLGVTQNSVLSPFLFNIYMHRLDAFMERLKEKYQVDAVRGAHPLYSSKRYELRKQLDESKANLKQRLRAFRALRKRLKRAGIPLYDRVTDQRNVHYSRYADDFIIGIKGSKQFGKEILKLVLEFIKSSLHFEVSSIHLVHARSDKTGFLSFLLSTQVLGARVKSRTIERFQRLKARVKVLRTAEYSAYLRMLREAEKRFWVQSLEKNLRKVNQTMMSRTQLLLGCEHLSKKKVLESLLLLIKEELKETESQVSHQDLFANSTFDNPRLSEARDKLEEHWRSIINNWSHRAKTLSRLVPEKDTELLEVLGEEKLKSLTETRQKYHAMLEKLDSAQLKGAAHVVDLIDKRCGASALMKREFEVARPTLPPSVRVEMPYEKVKAKLAEKGYIQNNFPCSKSMLTQLHDIDIIQHYTWLAKGILNFYRCADNKWQLIRLINWYLRYSLLHTLAHKRNKTIKQTIALYSINPSIWRKNPKGKLELLTCFIDSNEFNTMDKTFLVSENISPETFSDLLEGTTLKVHKGGLRSQPQRLTSTKPPHTRLSRRLLARSTQPHTNSPEGRRGH